MKLSALCKNCRSEVSFHTYQVTKSDFARKKGKTIAINCKKCAHSIEYHVNEFTARNIILRFIANAFATVLILFVALTLLSIIPHIGFINYLVSSIQAIVLMAGLPFIIWGIIMNSAIKSERAYNNYKVSEK